MRLVLLATTAFEILRSAFVDELLHIRAGHTAGNDAVELALVEIAQLSDLGSGQRLAVAARGKRDARVGQARPATTTGTDNIRKIITTPPIRIRMTMPSRVDSLVEVTLSRYFGALSGPNCVGVS